MKNSSFRSLPATFRASKRIDAQFADVNQLTSGSERCA
jgi:hypothetical protein